MVTNQLRTLYDFTASARRPTGGRNNRTIKTQYLDIVRLPAKFRYCFKFHGVRCLADHIQTPAGARTICNHERKTC